MGRPSIRTPEMIDAICERLSTGEPLAVICRDEGMPHRSTVDDWTKADEEIGRRIARARDAGEEALLSECLEIADDSRNDYIDKLAEEGDSRAVEARLNGEHVQRSKLRIETRLKLLAKFNPKRWGERTQIDHGVTGTLEQLVAASLPAALPAPSAGVPALTEGKTDEPGQSDPEPEY